MKVAVTGASGFVGRNLVKELEARGHEVVRIGRGPENPAQNYIHWDIDARQLNPESLEGCNAVIHLAGEGIAEKRWSHDQKMKIRSSRVNGTTLLVETLAALKEKPSVLVSASAIGYYGLHEADQTLDESSAAGSDYLAGVCEDWENAAKPAAGAGIRVVNIRIGVVLGPDGGAVAKMLTPFKLGLGGVIADGKQVMSWISRTDLVGALVHAVDTPSLEGPVNAVAPNPVSNRDFTKAMGSALKRPTVFPMPAFAARLAFGPEMADSILIGGAKVSSKKLQESGFGFKHSTVLDALNDELNG